MSTVPTLGQEDCRTRRLAIAVTAGYIDGFYNVSRRHPSLDYASPVECGFASRAKR